MKKLLKNAFLLVLACKSVLFVEAQNVYGQSNLHDSLRHILIRIETNVNDQILRRTIKNILESYTDSTINKTTVQKLLAIQNKLMKDKVFNRQMILTYSETLVNVLNQLPTEGEEKETYCYYCVSLINLALLYNDLGQYEKALPLYEQGLDIYKKKIGEENISYVISLNNMALLFLNMGEYDKALPRYQKAISICEKLLDQENQPYYLNQEVNHAYIKILNALAILYSKLGQYKKSESLFSRALIKAKEIFGEESEAYATVLNGRAVLYQSIGKFKQALISSQQSLESLRKVLGEAHPKYIMGLINYSHLYTSIGEYKQAKYYFEQSLPIVEKNFGGDSPIYATLLNNLALLYTKEGDYYKAQLLFEQALVIRKKVFGDEHPDYIVSLNNLGLLYILLNNPAKGLALISQASSIELSHLGHIITSLSEEEKLTLINRETYQFSLLPSILYTQNINRASLVNQAYANELMLKGMVLENQHEVLTSIRKSGDNIALHFYEQWRSNKTILGKQLLLPIRQRLFNLDSLQEIINQLEQQLSRHSEVFHYQQQRRAITIKNIAQRLQKDEAAVEFISFKLYNNKWTDSTLYAALILLPNDSNAHFIPLCEEKKLQDLLTIFSKRVITDSAIQKLYDNVTLDGNSPVLSNSLYELIWKPLEPYLIGIHTVYYAPSGLLHRVAFQALRTDTSHLLIDKYKLNQMLSTRSIAFSPQLFNKPKIAALWGDIEYNLVKSAASKHSRSRGPKNEDTTAFFFNEVNEDNRGLRGGGWKPLPSSKKEIDSLKRLLVTAGIRATISNGALASEEAFKALDGKSPQVLHLATHGFFLPVDASRMSEFEVPGGAFTVQQNPMFRSGLVLAGGNYAWQGGKAIAGKEDGILTAYEIAQLDLSTTDLMVLSACRTALGDLQGNEGVIGLQRALKMAGVKQLVISLWDVYDDASMELMTLFYQNWLNGQSSREALRKAQMKMKEKYPQETYNWAAFILVE